MFTVIRLVILTLVLNVTFAASTLAGPTPLREAPAPVAGWSVEPTAHAMAPGWEEPLELPPTPVVPLPAPLVPVALTLGLAAWLTVRRRVKLRR